MNKKDFHKRLKEILSANQGEHNSPNAQFHDVFDNEVRKRSGKDWDDATAAQVIREFEWVTKTQPKRDDIAETDIKTMLGDFMSERGYTPIHIEEGADKTPDCYIEKDGSKYLTEIKSPVLNIDIDSQLYKFKTSHAKILDHSRKAIKQLTAHDKNHTLPWVLIFTSSHFQLNWKTLTDTLQGGVIDQRGRRLPDFSNTQAYKNSVPLINQIDVLVWLQASGKSKQFHQASYFINEKSDYTPDCTELVRDLYGVRLSSLDNMISLQFNG